MKFQIIVALLGALNAVPSTLAQEPSSSRKLLRTSNHRRNANFVKVNNEEAFGNLNLDDSAELSNIFGIDSRMLQTSMSMPLVPPPATTLTDPSISTVSESEASYTSTLVSDPEPVVEVEPVPVPDPVPAPAPVPVPPLLPVIDSTPAESITLAKPPPATVSEQSSTQDIETDVTDDYYNDDAYYYDYDDYYYYYYYYEDDEPTDAQPEITPAVPEPVPEPETTTTETADISGQSDGSSAQTIDTTSTTVVRSPDSQQETVEVTSSPQESKVNMGAIVGVSVGAILAVVGAGFVARKKFADQQLNEF